MTKKAAVSQYSRSVRQSVVVALILCGAGTASADDECRGIDVELTPSPGLQIAAWIEDPAGTYVDTAYITQATGLRGLGNRTGDMNLHSGPMWPYGAREDVLPIWAHRHGLTWPRVVWQYGDGIIDGPDDADANLQTSFGFSSVEPYYCRPMDPRETMWDAGTCATTVFTDKGKLQHELISHYPPRADLTPGRGDSADVSGYAALDPFDAVSRATPPGDAPYRYDWIAPASLANGDYVLRIEVSKEFDFNATYTESTFPTTQSVWQSYGVPYRGQPSVLYEVPFTLDGTTETASTDVYAGYSDLDGNVHPPDATITTDTPGSGASRLRLAVAGDGSMFRARVTTHAEQDAIAPAGIRDLAVTQLEPTSVQLSFIASGDDGDDGTVTGYEIRYRAGYSLDESSFAQATPVNGVEPVAAGGLQTLALAELTPATPYVVGIRAYDNCRHEGPLVVVALETPSAEVSGCGCTSGDPGGLAIALLALRVRRRRSR